MTRLGVVGGGTMGSGIVQVAAQQGMDVVLLDVRQEFLDGALHRIQGFLDRSVERGRATTDEVVAIMARIHPTLDYGLLRDADCVIEAALEQLEIKSAVFRNLDKHCSPGAILATNTSSLSVAEIAAATTRPEQVVGLHFFNPVPLMALVEVVRGSATSAATLERATTIAKELGKTPVQTGDSPGFIVNRVVRPFYNEALRLLNDGIGDVATIDRAMKAVGFRMGPFELMDLIGNDINFAVTSSIYEQFFGDPKYRPSFRQQRLVQGGLLGQKTKQGWYSYPLASSEPVTSVETAARLKSAIVVADTWHGVELTAALRAAGTVVDLLRVENSVSPEPEDVATLVGAGSVEVIIDGSTGTSDGRRATMRAVDRSRVTGTPVLSSALTVAPTEAASWLRQPDALCGFAYLPPLKASSGIEVSPALQTGYAALQAAHRLAWTLGKAETLLGPADCGLVAARIVAMIVNEAAYALMEGVASAADIDAAVRLGANYPLGPLGWADTIGVDTVYTMVQALCDELGEDRYRPAPLLRRMAQAGWHGQATGRGFFTYGSG